MFPFQKVAATVTVVFVDETRIEHGMFARRDYSDTSASLICSKVGENEKKLWLINKLIE